MAEKLCASCQTGLDPDAVFCNECGTVQPSAVSPASSAPQAAKLKVCPKCAKQLAESIKFCPSCRFDFTSAPVLRTGPSVCPKCSKAYVAEDRFCRHCAFDLSTVKRQSSAHFCTACATPFESGDRFCRNCAADLSASNQTVAVPTVAPARSIPPASIPNVGQQAFRAVPVQATVPAAADVAPTGRMWFSPSAAGFALICFFMPWAEVSCNALGTRLGSRGASGADLAELDGSLWFLPLIAAAIVGAFFYFRSQNKLSDAGPFIAGAAFFALVFMLYKLASLNPDMDTATKFTVDGQWGTGIEAEWKFGVIGVALGFAAAIVGVFVEPSLGSKLRRAGFGAHADLPKHPDHLSEANVPAMLCYLVPLIMYFIAPNVVVVFGLLANTVGLIGGLFSLVMILMMFACVAGYPIFILKGKAYDGKPRTRFHAWQSVMMIGCSVILSAGMIVFDTPGNYTTSSVFMIYIVLGLGFLNLALMILMSNRAFKDFPLKLPVIGAWSENLTKKSTARQGGHQLI